MGLNILRHLVAHSTILQTGILAGFMPYIAALSVDFFLLFMVILIHRFFAVQRGELFPQLQMAGVAPLLQLTAVFDLILALMLLDLLTESLILLFVEDPIFSRSAEFLTT